MKWTEELPRKEGWYLWRIERYDCERCYYMTMENGRLLASTVKGGSGLEVLPQAGVLWAGPMPEPKEREK